MKIQEAVIAITGAGQGLGRQMALHLAQRGAHLALLDIDQDALAQTQQLITQAGGRAAYFICNVAQEQAVEKAFKDIEATFGKLNGLINNAGILKDSLLLKEKNGVVSNKMSLQQWQSVIDVNLTGVFLCGREAAIKMLESRSPGCIINISSVARCGNIGQTNYSAAKAGVVAMTVTWAKELGSKGIRCMAIAPGFIVSDMTNSMKPEARAHLTNMIPLGDAGQAEHIAQAAVHIFENDYMTGRVMEVDGGLRV